MRLTTNTENLTSFERCRAQKTRSETKPTSPAFACSWAIFAAGLVPCATVGCYLHGICSVAGRAARVGICCLQAEPQQNLAKQDLRPMANEI